MPDKGISILGELIILLAFSLPITYIFHHLKLPAIVGFLATGVLIGPHGAAVITATTTVERLAEIGVVLLLFTVGLEFSFTNIVKSGRQFLAGATVIAIVRDGEAVTNPRPDIRLQPDDILVLLGAHKELDAAVNLLTRNTKEDDPSEG